MIDEILGKIRVYNQEFDEQKIKRAFDLISRGPLFDEKKLRQSISIVNTLIPMKPDNETIIAAVLYSLYDVDVLNDEEVFEVFGQDVLNLLQGVGKLKSLNYKENDKTAQLEAMRKMFVTMAKDIRVVLIKLALRLYKMMNIKDFATEGERASFAKETFDVYVPVASRLGIYRLKVELEDISFMYLNPLDYAVINDQIEKLGRSRKIAIAIIKKELEQFLDACGYREVEVLGRLKSVYSIYRKLKNKNLDSINDIYDIFAMRIILPSQYDEKENEKVDYLYNLLGLIHSHWRPVTKKFKDYIAVPKPNGYKSLHTVVLDLVPGEPTKPVEIQIRSFDMHRQAEYGVASHWVYKQAKNKSSMAFNDVLQYQVDWVKGLEKIHENMEGDSDVLKEVEVDIFKDRIFVLTPKGEIKDLPVGSCALDFAFAVHTDVGIHCIMTKVNGSVVTLDHELKNGDVVEVISKQDSWPKLQWLSMVKTTFAKAKIKNWFNRLDRENYIKQGKLLLNKQLEILGLPSLDQGYSVLKNFAGHSLTVAQRESLVEEVGRGHKLAGNVVKNVYPFEEILKRKEALGIIKVPTTGHTATMREDEEVKNKVLVGGEAGLPIKLGACCNPAVRDEIIGYITRGNRITIHSKSCVKLQSLNPKRMLEASWKNAGPKPDDRKNYRVKVRASSHVSRVGLIRDITAVVASFGFDIVDIRLDITDQKVYNLHMVILMYDISKFNSMMDKIGRVDDVVQVVKEETAE